LLKKSEARTALPSTSSAPSDKVPAPKSATQKAKNFKDSKPFKKIRERKEVNYKEDSGSLLLLCSIHLPAVRHTDDESDGARAYDAYSYPQHHKKSSKTAKRSRKYFSGSESCPSSSEPETCPSGEARNLFFSIYFPFTIYIPINPLVGK